MVIRFGVSDNEFIFYLYSDGTRVMVSLKFGVVVGCEVDAM